VIGAFVSRPPFNVLRLRIARSHETTVPGKHHTITTGFYSANSMGGAMDTGW